MKTSSNGKKHTEFTDFLRKVAQKGFFEILIFIQSNPQAHYNEITKYAVNKKLLKSPASITIFLNTFTEYGILQRRITTKRPIRTSYSTSAKGTKVIRLLKNLEKAL